MALVGEILRQSKTALADKGISESQIEAELMLMHILQVPRHHVYAYQEQEIQPAQEQAINIFMQRRLNREPLAYILGYRAFYGLTLRVRTEVMIPRSETELLVEHVLAMAMMGDEEEDMVIAEAGVGCGAISINLAVHLPLTRIYATDLYPGALDVARSNVTLHNVADRVTLLQGDLLEPVPEPVNVIIANLPYVKSDLISRLQPEIQWEPREALDGGPDGLEVIRRLLYQSKGKLKEGGLILLEIDPEHVELLMDEVERLFPNAAISTEQDLAHHDRLFIVKPEHT